MLEKLLQRTGRIVLGGLVALLSAVFVFSFGGPTEWSPETKLKIAEVYDRSIKPGELQAAFLLAGGENYPADMAERYQLEPMLLLGLVERSLLAREARGLGMRVSEDEVLEAVADHGLIHLSMSVDAQPVLPRSGPVRYQFTDSDGKFSKENLKNFIEFRLRRSVSDFARSQVEETLAQRMREAVVANVAVAPGEVFDAWVREKESVTLGYARFSSVYYAKQVEPTDAELTAWMTANTADVDAEYEKQKHRYTGLEKQVRARHVLIKVAQDASDEDKAAAREKIDGLRARAVAGEDFAALAREHSEDAGSAVKGGDLGFNPKGRMVPTFDEAQFALAPGGISEVVESSFGFHVINVTAVREGDVPIDEAKREIATQLHREREAAKRAEADARIAHAKLKGGMPVEELEVLLREGRLVEKPAAPAEAPAEPAAEPAAEGEAVAEKPEEPAAPDPLAPAWRATAPFGRGDTAIPGPFDSRPLVKIAYGLTEAKPVPDAPVRLGDDWFVVRLEAREQADREAFSDEDRTRLHDALLARRRQDVLAAYVRSLRLTAEQEGAIQPEIALLTGGAPAAPALPPQ